MKFELDEEGKKFLEDMCVNYFVLKYEKDSITENIKTLINQYFFKKYADYEVKLEEPPLDWIEKVLGRKDVEFLISLDKDGESSVAILVQIPRRPRTHEEIMKVAIDGLAHNLAESIDKDILKTLIKESKEYECNMKSPKRVKFRKRINDMKKAKI